MASLRALECPVAVADTGSITQAALLCAKPDRGAARPGHPRVAPPLPAPENGPIIWLDQALTAAGVRPEPAMMTAGTAAAPQLAAAGLGIAVSLVSAVSTDFPGVVRPFSPRWVRQLVAVTPEEPDPLLARFLGYLRKRGLRVPRGVRTQIEQS
jgi:DNA-binding transcriptional LysR family regulator